VTGDAQPYQYLVESIRKFPVPERFSQMIAAVGFKRVTHTPMSGNIAALHAAWKL
jgi:demethylmenaquinone methyltransferase/2-methoxy-6-polyprenyl-1,4-benzoquinol methylase